jgi:peptidoglycan/LPS O-acetylase OafA/YrhL
VNTPSVEQGAFSSAAVAVESPALSSAAERRNIKGYRPELDVVRFCAFLLVFFSHILPRGVDQWNRALCARLNPFQLHMLTAVGDSCGMGLCLFFALSAYLITMLLLREREIAGRISIPRFYVRRILRIWPLYFFGLSIGFAGLILSHQAADCRGLVWFLFFAGNIYGLFFHAISSPMEVLWSISVEEQFYLIWPLAMRWLSKRGLVAVAMLFLVVANITLFVLGNRHADTDVAVWQNTFVQFEMFAVGILLALWRRKFNCNVVLGTVLITATPLLWYLACFAFHAKQSPSQGHAVSGPILMCGYALIALGCGCVLSGFSMLDPSRMPEWAVNLGRISFGLYVYHLLALHLAEHAIWHWVGRTGLRAYLITFFLQIPISLTITIVAARLSYRFLEKPFLQLKVRFETVHSRPI